MFGFFQQISRGEVPIDDEVVLEQAQPINEAEMPPAAEADDAPDFNEPQTDPNPRLVGLNQRMLAPHWVGSVKPVADTSGVAATVDYARIINEQVSTSGRAASEEAAGNWGHGSMPYGEALEPVIRDGLILGSDYFVGHARDLTEPFAGDRGVGSAIGDRATWLAAGSAASTRAREAYAASQIYSEYGTFHKPTE